MYMDTQAKEQIIKDYVKNRMSEIGKKSAQSPIRTKEYYSDLGRKSAEKRRMEREKHQNSPSTIIYNILAGKI